MMKHKIVLALAGPLLLGSCALFGLPTTYLFKHNPNQADPSAVGNAVASESGGGMVTTVLSLSGLTPGKAYIADRSGISLVGVVLEQVGGRQAKQGAGAEQQRPGNAQYNLISLHDVLRDADVR